MRLMHNMPSLYAYTEQNKAIKSQSVAMGRISSGVKMSSAKEGPNELAQSEKMRMQIRGLQMAQRNAQDGASMLQVAEGGLDTVTSELQRIRELTISAGGAKDPTDLTTIQGEIKQLVSGINDAINGTEFNGIKVLKDTNVTDNEAPGTITTLVGGNPDEVAKIPTYNLNSSLIGDMKSVPAKTLDTIDITKTGGIDEALGIIDSAMTKILDVRGNYGALENRFSSTYEVDGDLGDSTQRAESSIRDVDIAKEMSDYARATVLSDAGTAIMVQTNNFPMDALKILDNIGR